MCLLCSNGILEDWNIGMMDFFFPLTIPLFQHSIIPIDLGDHDD
jgi:hypothetical protein